MPISLNLTQKITGWAKRKWNDVTGTWDEATEPWDTIQDDKLVLQVKNTAVSLNLESKN